MTQPRVAVPVPEDGPSSGPAVRVIHRSPGSPAAAAAVGHPTPLPRGQRGLTVIEMMIALALGLILTLGAIQIFASSRMAYRANEALARIQENGRYALHFLKRDIRNAAYWGCADDVEVNNVVVGTSVDFDAPATVGEERGAALPDALTLRMANRNSGINVVKQMPTTSADLFLSDTDSVQEGDIMIVTDCESADIFMVTNNNTLNDNLAHNSGVVVNGVQNSTQVMSKSYGTDAIAFVVSQRLYEVVNDRMQRSVNGSPAAELVNGINDLELTYGVDSDNNEVPNAYLDADEIDASPLYSWDEVLTIRIRLLVRSDEDNIVTSPQAQIWDFDGDGTLDAAPDRRMYQQFTATVGVRNRLP